MLAVESAARNINMSLETPLLELLLEPVGLSGCNSSTLLKIINKFLLVIKFLRELTLNEYFLLNAELPSFFVVMRELVLFKNIVPQCLFIVESKNCQNFAKKKSWILFMIPTITRIVVKYVVGEYKITFAPQL